MTTERMSEGNDGHQVRATIGLAGGCALQALIRQPSLAPWTSILAIAGG